jgi:hypothetical protein
VSIWDVTTTPAGQNWDAVRIPQAFGVALCKRLTGNPDWLPRLGPVVLSELSEATYWLIPTGTRPADWPEPCRLLSTGTWIVLPEDSPGPRGARWLHRPDQLTAAVWLTRALAQAPVCVCGVPVTGVPTALDSRDPSAGIVDVTHDACYQLTLDRPLGYRHEGAR